MPASRLVAPLLLSWLLTALLAGPLAEPVAATADGCVTRAELREARYGMPKARVHRRLGTRGERIYLVVGNEEKRAYRMCDPSKRLTITYLHGDLAYKHVRG